MSYDPNTYQYAKKFDFDKYIEIDDDIDEYKKEYRKMMKEEKRQEDEKRKI